MWWVWAGFNMRYIMDGLDLDYTWAVRGLGMDWVQFVP